VTRVLIAGGGLAGSLVAWRLRQTRPDLQLLVLERGPRLGGNHTWSFHETDLSPAEHRCLAPLVARSWPGYEVRFPSRKRSLEGAYHSITSERLHAVVSQSLGPSLRLGSAVRVLDEAGATLDDGTRLPAELVLDARGLHEPLPFELGYQKFLGRFVTLEADHGLTGPMLMDATVEQRDGYRFLYVLPWSSRTVLIEDTRYSETAGIDRDEFRAGIEAYALQRGWRISSVEREEEGILPVPMAGDIDAFWAGRSTGAATIGMRAALFHPTTGYSLPQAVGLAEALPTLSELTTRAVARFVRERSIRLWRRGAFFRLLNRMLFRAAAPAERYRVLQRFYSLPEALIHRFYAGRLTTLDQIRLLSGRPPVPVGRAARCLFESRIAAGEGS
jgi:lycopene beta-cyclase